MRNTAKHVFTLIVSDLTMREKQNMVQVVAFISFLQEMKKYLKLRKHTFNVCLVPDRLANIQQMPHLCQ